MTPLIQQFALEMVPPCLLYLEQLWELLTIGSVGELELLVPGTDYLVPLANVEPSIAPSLSLQQMLHLHAN